MWKRRVSRIAVPIPMQQRATLTAAILALVLVAFARCEPPPAAYVPGIGQEPNRGDRPLPKGEAKQFQVMPFGPDAPNPQAPNPQAPTPQDSTPQDPNPKAPRNAPLPKDRKRVATVPFDQLPVPVPRDRFTVHHHILFADVDDPHADEDMVIKPPGAHTWPMPVLPLVK